MSFSTENDRTCQKFLNLLVTVRTVNQIKSMNISSGKHVHVKYTPLTPTLYSKNGVYRGIPIFSYFLLQNIDCGYSLEPPRRGGSNEYPQSMF